MRWFLGDGTELTPELQKELLLNAFEGYIKDTLGILTTYVCKKWLYKKKKKWRRAK